MATADTARLNQTIAETKSLVGDGLLAMDIWDRASAVSLAAHNTQPEAIALFTEVTAAILGAFEGKPFPTLDNYYLLDLQAGHTVVIMQPTPDLVCGMLMSTPAVDLSAVVGTVIPRVLGEVASAATAAA